MQDGLWQRGNTTPRVACRDARTIRATARSGSAAAERPARPENSHDESAAHRCRNGSGGCAPPLLSMKRGMVIIVMWAPRTPEEAAAAALMPRRGTVECAQPSPLRSAKPRQCRQCRPSYPCVCRRPFAPCVSAPARHLRHGHNCRFMMLGP